MALGISQKHAGICMPAIHCSCGRPARPTTPEQELQLNIDIGYDVGMQPATEAEIEEAREIIFA